MSTPRFVLVASVGLTLAAVCLALAAAIGSSVLAVASVLFLLVVFAAREGWLWESAAGQWLIMMIGLALVVAVAAAVEHLS